MLTIRSEWGSTITQKVRNIFNQNPNYNDRITWTNFNERGLALVLRTDEFGALIEHLRSEQGTMTPSLKTVRKGVLKEMSVWQMLNNCLVCVNWCIIFFSLSDSCVSNCKRVYEWNVKFHPCRVLFHCCDLGGNLTNYSPRWWYIRYLDYRLLTVFLKWKLQNYCQLDLFVFYGPFNFPITHQNIRAKWTLNCL